MAVPDFLYLVAKPPSNFLHRSPNRSDLIFFPQFLRPAPAPGIFMDLPSSFYRTETNRKSWESIFRIWSCLRISNLSSFFSTCFRFSGALLRISYSVTLSILVLCVTRSPFLSSGVSLVPALYKVTIKLEYDIGNKPLCTQRHVFTTQYTYTIIPT